MKMICKVIYKVCGTMVEDSFIISQNQTSWPGSHWQCGGRGGLHLQARHTSPALQLLKQKCQGTWWVCSGMLWHCRVGLVVAQFHSNEDVLWRGYALSYYNCCICLLHELPWVAIGDAVAIHSNCCETVMLGWVKTKEGYIKSSWQS